MILAELLNVGGNISEERSKVYGVVTGIITDIKDPKKIGRVKVNFPWLAEEVDAVTISKEEKEEDSAHSYWARIATLMAGAKRGAWFVPEVGEEVLVAFEHGEIDRPFVLGMLWNTNDAPPESMDAEGKNDIRYIHSRSGHKIILNDSEDKPSITIMDKTGENSIFIDSANNAMEIKGAGDLSISVGGNISIKAEGKIDIEAAKDISAQTQGNLSTKATGKSDFEASGAVTVKSDTKVSIDGTGQTEIKATKIGVNGSAMTEIKGGLVKIN